MKKPSAINKQGVVLKDPPASLVLNRKYVQQFPNGQKVAIYYCPTLKKNFSLTYDKNEVQLSESDFSIIDILKSIKEVETIYFNDGSETNINEECSKNILELYSSLEEGKSDFEEFVMESESNFLKLLRYSVNKFNQET